jgi:hypothetical protein
VLVKKDGAWKVASFQNTRLGGSPQ